MDMSLGSPDAKRANTNQHSGLDLYNDDGAGGDESTQLAFGIFFHAFIYPPLHPSLDPFIPSPITFVPHHPPPSFCPLSLNQCIHPSIELCRLEPASSTAY